MEKNKEMSRAVNGGLMLVEDKNKGLPNGGDGWDKNMKRKHSVGTLAARTMDVDGELKQGVEQRQNIVPRSQSCDDHEFRLGSTKPINGINKLDGSSRIVTPSDQTMPMNDLDNVSLPNDITKHAAGLDKERVIAKANTKYVLNNYEDNHEESSLPLTKEKAFRVPRAGSGILANSSSNFPCTPGVLDGWEQPSFIDMVQSLSGENNHKLPMHTGSPSPPVTQWVGQRPQKISRTRRANLVSPVSNHDESQILSAGLPSSDLGARFNSTETNGPLLARGISNNAQQLKLKFENVLSSVGLLDSEESGAGENKSKQKGILQGKVDEKAVNAVQSVPTFIFPTKKNKDLIKEVGDGIQRQAKSGRGSAQSRACIPSMREKLENTITTNPLRSTRPVSDKSESKPGRPPLKKMSGRKFFTCRGPAANIGSSKFSGGSYDDHAELLAAAISVRDAYLACSGPFWKKMEPVFSSVSLEDLAYLQQQKFFAVELVKSLSHIFGPDLSILSEVGCKVMFSSQVLAFGERQGTQQNGIELNESARNFSSVDESQKVDTLHGEIKTERWFDLIVPLSQRLLSAIIVEDETEKFDPNSEGRDAFFQDSSGDFPCNIINHMDNQHKDVDRMEAGIGSGVDFKTQQHGSLDKFSSNKSTASNSFRTPGIRNHLFNDDMWPEDEVLVHSEVGVTPFGQNHLEAPQPTPTSSSGISSIESHYQQMCLEDRILLELHSIGIYPEKVPDLAEGVDGDINKDISELQKRFYQQVREKKGHLCKLLEAILHQKEIEERSLEQMALNKLVEIAYKKHMACQRSKKGGVSKVAKQTALAFVKQTLARCQKFEETGKSCFSEPPLRDVIFSPPLCSNGAEGVDCIGTGAAANTYTEAHNYQQRSRRSAAGAFASVFSSTFKQHGPIEDVLEKGSPDAFQAPLHTADQTFAKHESMKNIGKKREVHLEGVVGSAASIAVAAIGSAPSCGAKGKRSERDRDQNKDMSLRNSVPKVGRPPSGNIRGERKTKAKSKQKTGQSSSRNVILGGITERANAVLPLVCGSFGTVNNDSKVKREMELLCPGNIVQDSSKVTEEPIGLTNFQLNGLYSIEELGVSDDLGGQVQDLTSWLNFDEDGLQDHDSVGLEIPTDDLSDLNMIM